MFKANYSLSIKVYLCAHYFFYPLGAAGFESRGDMERSFYDYCEAQNNTNLLSQWNTELNGDLTPQNVAAFSRKKVWWRCEKGHEWQTMVKLRSGGERCPVCANRKVQSGVNDLATTYPEIAAQWHPAKNGDLTPDSVLPGMHLKVWWVCEKGHEWQAQINSRKQGCGCPVCAGQKIVAGENDLGSRFPEIAAQWHHVKNGDRTPQNVSAFSNRKVWWVCEKGHEYEAVIADRTDKEKGCPYCAGRRVLSGFNDLATLHPEIAAQWHPELNGDLTPEDVTPGSNKKVWWRCENGHVWQAYIFSRTGKRKHSCPVCAGTVSRKLSDRYSSVVSK